ncbi:MAG: hypothetical protein WBD58_04400, partial [Geitlerinemataceae cyanobacterium]
SGTAHGDGKCPTSGVCADRRGGLTLEGQMVFALLPIIDQFLLARLVEMGVPKQDFVLAFHEPEERSTIV